MAANAKTVLRSFEESLSQMLRAMKHSSGLQQLRSEDRAFIHNALAYARAATRATMSELSDTGKTAEELEKGEIYCD